MSGPHVGFSCGAFDFSIRFHSHIKQVSPPPNPFKSFNFRHSHSNTNSVIQKTIDNR
jgi:hypothetical protein